jgi:biotin carboxylase
MTMRILFPNPTIHIKNLIESLKYNNCELDLLIPNYREVKDELIDPDYNYFRAETEKQYIELLNELCEKNSYDYIFPNYFDTHIVDIAKINEKYNMPGITVSTAGILIDKFSYYNKFKELKISCPKIYKKVLENETNINISNCNIEYPCIVKPTVGTGSSGIRIIENEKELRLFFASNRLAHHYGITGRNPEGEYLIQEYIQGKVICPMGHISNGKLKTDFYQEIIPSEKPFFPERGLSMPIDIDNSILTKIDNDIDIFCSAIGLDNTAWRCEVIVTDDNYYFIDFGARIGGLNNQILLEYVGESNYGWKLIDSILNNTYQSLNLKYAAIYQELDLPEENISDIEYDADLVDYMHLPKEKIKVSLIDTDVFKNGFAIIKSESVEECSKKYQKLMKSLTFTVTR